MFVVIFIICPLSLLFIYLYDRILPSKTSKVKDFIDSLEQPNDQKRILFLRALIWTTIIVIPRMFYAMHFSLITSLITFAIILFLYYRLEVRYFIRSKLRPKYKLLFSVVLMFLTTFLIILRDAFLN